jgi:hypothetical protein
MGGRIIKSEEWLFSVYQSIGDPVSTMKVRRVKAKLTPENYLLT